MPEPAPTVVECEVYAFPPSPDRNALADAIEADARSGGPLTQAIRRAARV